MRGGDTGGELVSTALRYLFAQTFAALPDSLSKLLTEDLTELLNARGDVVRRVHGAILKPDTRLYYSSEQRLVT